MPWKYCKKHSIFAWTTCIEHLHCVHACCGLWLCPRKCDTANSRWWAARFVSIRWPYKWWPREANARILAANAQIEIDVRANRWNGRPVVELDLVWCNFGCKNILTALICSYLSTFPILHRSPNIEDDDDGVTSVQISRYCSTHFDLSHLWACETATAMCSANSIFSPLALFQHWARARDVSLDTV